MQINFTGHGLSVTPALKELAEQKLTKLRRHSDKISTVQITFDVQKIEQIAEGSIIVEGNEIHAKSSSDDMYKAIDEMIKKLDTQLLKYKGKSIHHRDDRDYRDDRDV